MCYTVYIIYSESTDTFYKGQTKDLFDRLKRHNAGYERSTSKGIPWKLVWRAQKNSRADAMILERKLKNLSREKLLKFIARNHSLDLN